MPANSRWDLIRRLRVNLLDEMGDVIKLKRHLQDEFHVCLIDWPVVELCACFNLNGRQIVCIHISH